jgi:lactoylglutathione lyase
MIPIRGVYEVAIPVRSLKRAEAFYCDVLGLAVGLRDEPRKWVFLRAGGQNGVLLLQEDTQDWAPRHFAFNLDEADLDGAVAALRQKGVSVTEPVTHAWMPARSIYFSDPDGHALELCAPLAAR